MPFGRLHEEAAGDAKLLALTDAAWRMWGMGLVYCQRNLTDGFIPDYAIETFGVRAPNKTTVADELCRPQVHGRAPLWEKVEGGYQVHDYLQWNDSRAKILAGRQEAKSRMRRSRTEHPTEQSGEHPPEHSTEHHIEHTTEPVVRGSECTDREGSRSSQQRSGAFEAGSLPRHHLKHAYCDSTHSRCVPQQVHDKLTNQLAPKHGGNRSQASSALLAWYPTVLKALPADAVMGDEFKFWQPRFDAAFATPAAPAARPSELRSVVPDADTTKRHIAALRSQAS